MIITSRKDIEFSQIKLTDLQAKEDPLSSLKSPLSPKQLVLIFAGQHRTFWRANGSGYTYDVDQAGVYTLEDAYKRTRHCGSEKEICFVWNYDYPNPRQWRT